MLLFDPFFKMVEVSTDIIEGVGELKKTAKEAGKVAVSLLFSPENCIACHGRGYIVLDDGTKTRCPFCGGGGKGAHLA